jgi:hypothetical membrane protein
MSSIAEILLISGVVTTVVFVAVLLIEGALRPGYNPVYHTGSELELGKRGWIMRANFLLMALGMIAFAVGIYLRLNTVAGAVLLVIFSFGLIIAGAFVPDPVRGYPPGATSQASAKLTWRHQLHHASGPIMFLALFAACLVLSARLQGVWQLYTVLTVVAGFALMIWLVLAYQRNAAHTGLVQRALILVCWSWIVLLVIHLIQHPPQP